MASRRTIKEYDLLEYARCLLRAPEQLQYLPSMEERGAEFGLQRILRHASLRKEPMGLLEAVDRMEAGWAEAVGYDPELQTCPPPDTIRLAKTFVNFLREYQVLKPISHYSRSLGPASITGEYAVVAKHVNGPWYALRFSRQAIPVGFTDVVNYVRWLDLQMEAPDRECHLLHLDGAGEVRLDLLPSEKMVRASLTNLIERILEKKHFPSPSLEYCLTCHTKGCMGTKPKLIPLHEPWSARLGKD